MLENVIFRIFETSLCADVFDDRISISACLSDSQRHLVFSLRKVCIYIISSNLDIVSLINTSRGAETARKMLPGVVIKLLRLIEPENGVDFCGPITQLSGYR